LVTPRFGDPLAATSYLIDGMPMPSLMAAMFLSSMQAKGGAAGMPTRYTAAVVNYVWRDSWVDSTDLGREYSFEYEGQTYTDKGASVATNRGSFTTGDVSFFPLALTTNVLPNIVQSPPDVAGIRIEIELMLKDPKRDCAAFVQGLLERVDKGDGNTLVDGGDIIKIFDRINSPDQKGMIRSGALGSYVNVNGVGGPYALGKMAEHTARIQLGTIVPGPPTAFSDALIALHETIHHAGQHGYGDKALSLALSRWTGKPILDPDGNPPSGEPGEDIRIYSAYWGTELANHCK
jgi:hypothetical protein